MLALIAQALWLALPVIVAAVFHMIVVKRSLWPSLAVPLDGGAQLGGRPIFGANKTWRGVVVMTAAGALLGAAQGALGGGWASGAGLELPRAAGGEGPGGWALGYGLSGAVLGLGYVLGELPNSFAKRRLDIGPGGRGAGAWGPVFFVVDRCDSVVAALALGALVFGFDLRLVVVGTGCLALVHLLVSALLHRARLKASI